MGVMQMEAPPNSGKGLREEIIVLSLKNELLDRAVSRDYLLNDYRFFNPKIIIFF